MPKKNSKPPSPADAAQELAPAGEAAPKRPAHRPKGTPDLLTPELTARIAGYLGAGMQTTEAAVLAGVSRPSIYLWIKLGRAGEQPYDAFARAVDEAVAQAEYRGVLGIATAAESDWKAAAWLLERRFPERYSPKQNINVQVDKELENALSKLERALPAKEYERVLGVLATADAGVAAPPISDGDDEG